MKNSPIIFCHYGKSKYLKYVFECVKISNPNTEIILLGDSSNQKIARNYGLKHFLLKDYDFGDDLKIFDQVYKLIATKAFDAFKHGKDWNEFVFRKWFILNNFLVKHKIERFWHFDSDNMIFSNLSTLEHKYLDLDCTVQCHGKCMKGFFANQKIIERYIKKINEVFSCPKHIDSFRHKIKNAANLSCITEMTIYGIFDKEESFKSIMLNKVDNASSFDDLIYSADGMQVEKFPLGGNPKMVFMNIDGRFICKEQSSGNPVEMHALNLSWVPIYIYKAVLKHFKKNYKKPKQPLSLKAKTLAQIKLPLKEKLKSWRKKIKQKLKKRP